MKVKYPVGGQGAFDVLPTRAIGGVTFIVGGEGFVEGRKFMIYFCLLLWSMDFFWWFCSVVKIA